MWDRRISLDDDVRDLVILARQQDANAFSALIQHFERAALGVAYAILRDADRAGDAVQEAFLRAWQQLSKLSEAEKFGAWLMQIVRHAAIDSLRRMGPTVGEFPELAATGDGPEAEAMAADQEARVKAALAQLDETTREAVMLRYYRGHSTKEIALLLGMSPAAVDMRISRGRAALREQLQDLVEPDAMLRPGIGGRP